MADASRGAAASDDKVMALRYAGKCRLCGRPIPARVKAVYERSRKTVRCLDCDAPGVGPKPSSYEPPAALAGGLTQGATAAPPEPVLAQPPPEAPGEKVYVHGQAGGSARAEFERRHKKREDKVRQAHPKIGGFLLAITDDPQATAAWGKGASGEEVLGRRMNKAAGPLLRVLHDRRVPGTRSNIDHIAVAPTGVWVIDAKKYQGRPALRVEGGLFSPRAEKLMVGRRDCAKLVDSVLRQVEIVKAALAAAGETAPVWGALCFVNADWPLLGGAITTRGVRALWWDKLLSALRQPGDLDADAVGRVAQRLAEALPAY
ncbi:MAG: NERD domain-containing protein [Bifidobacteriaceae bacterium]|jgi:hypothetical protein|nr:NERD domain-containing protein [Bifidobacteriaceae bacterium]